MRLDHRRILFFVMAVLATGANVSCQGDPRSWYYTTKQPQVIDLAGEYRLDPSNWQNDWYSRLKLKLPPSTFTLNSNGTFTAIAVPDCVFTIGNCTGETADVEGNWRVAYEQSSWDLDCVTTKKNGLPWEFGFKLMLMNNKPPFTLHFIFGDPDSGNGLSYDRRK